MVAVRSAKDGQGMLVNAQGVAAMIVGGNPKIVIAGHKRLLAIKWIKELEALRKMLVGANVAAEEKQIGRVLLKVFE
jgi:hypothetical protein